MTLSKTKLNMFSVGFRLINIGIAILLILHFMFPGLSDSTAVASYPVIILGLLLIIFVWRDFVAVLVPVIIGMIFSISALQALDEQGIGLFVYMDYANHQTGIWWGAVVCLIDLLSMFLLAVLIRKKMKNQLGTRLYTKGDEMLYAKLKGKAISASENMVKSLAVTIPVFIIRVIIKRFMTDTTANTTIAGMDTTFLNNNLTVLLVLVLIILIPCVILVCWYFSDICFSIKNLVHDQDGRNKTL